MSDKKIPLVEVFGPTIQGEGAVIGQQTYFLRFGLCDYLCKMCDSMHAVDPVQVRQNAEWLTQEEIFRKLEDMKLPGSTNWVTFSGGNPCIHDLTQLCDLLSDAGWRCHVETQGTKAPDWLQQCDLITVSPKGPGMGEKTDLKALDAFIAATSPLVSVAMKIVVFDARDLEFAKMLYERYKIQQHKPIPFYLSLGNPYPPGKDKEISGTEHMYKLIGDYKSIFEQIKTDGILSSMRFLPQWHVFVWGNEKGK